MGTIFWKTFYISIYLEISNKLNIIGSIHRTISYLVGKLFGHQYTTHHKKSKEKTTVEFYCEYDNEKKLHSIFFGSWIKGMY